MRLRPGTALLRLDSSSIQVGTDPGHHLRLTGLTASEQQWLEAMANVREEDSATRQDPDPPSGAQRILTQLGAADLLDVPQPRKRLTIRLQGITPAALLALALLPETIDLTVSLSDPRPVDADLDAVLGGGSFSLPRDTSCAAFLTNRRPSTRIVRRRNADLVLVGGDRILDPAVTARLNTDDAPQILVTRHERGYEVGPVVFPGTTACHLCVEARRFDDDPDRLAHAKQALRLPLARASATGHTGAAVRLAALIERLAAGRLTVSECQTITWIGADGSPERRETVSPRYECPCGAAGEPFVVPVADVA